MSSGSDTRTTSSSASTQPGTPASNGSYSGTFTASASESSPRKKIKGRRLPTDQKNWSDRIHQQCKPKFPKFKAGKHPYLKQGLKYWGHSPRDAWSRGIVDYDPCDTLECGCAPKYEDDGPCVVNNNCPNCPKIPHRPVHKKRTCPQDFRPPRPVISRPFTPVATVKLIKSYPARPLPKPVPSRPLRKPVVSRPILVPVTSKPSTPWPAATVKLVKSNPSRPITKPSPSRPIPKPIISRPKSVPSRPLPKPVVSRPPPKPVVSRPTPVISTAKPIVSRPKPMPKSPPSRSKPSASKSPPPKQKSPPPKLKSFPPLEPKTPKSISRTSSSTSSPNRPSTSSKKHTKKSQKSSSTKKDSSSSNKDSSSSNKDYSSSNKYSGSSSKDYSSSGPSYSDSSSYDASIVEYHYYEYSSDTDDSKPQKKTEPKPPKPLKQSPSDALRMAILLRRQNAQRSQVPTQIPDPEHPILTNPDEGVSVLYTSPGVVPQNFNQRGSDDEGHALFGDLTETVQTGRSLSLPVPPQDPSMAPRLMGSKEFKTQMPFSENATMTTDLPMPSSQRVTFEDNPQEIQLDYSNNYTNQ